MTAMGGNWTLHSTSKTIPPMQLRDWFKVLVVVWALTVLPALIVGLWYAGWKPRFVLDTPGDVVSTAIAGTLALLPLLILPLGLQRRS
jgi:hypothetical protein